MLIREKKIVKIFPFLPQPIGPSIDPPDDSRHDCHNFLITVITIVTLNLSKMEVMSRPVSASHCEGSPANPPCQNTPLQCQTLY